MSNKLYECLCCKREFVKRKHAKTQGCCSILCANQIKWPPVEKRLWDNVLIQPDDQCWLWLGCVNHDGYGQIYAWKKHTSAHRVAWILTNGPLLPGRKVLHSCDIPSCCRPSHLFLGTDKDNAIDAKIKGRLFNAKGEDHPRTKFKNDDITYIRFMTGKIPNVHLAKDFGVSPTTICDIQKRKSWNHLP